MKYLWKGFFYISSILLQLKYYSLNIQWGLTIIKFYKIFSFFYFIKFHLNMNFHLSVQLFVPLVTYLSNVYFIQGFVFKHDYLPTWYSVCRLNNTRVAVSDKHKKYRKGIFLLSNIPDVLNVSMTDENNATGGNCFDKLFPSVKLLGKWSPQQVHFKNVLKSGAREPYTKSHLILALEIENAYFYSFVLVIYLCVCLFSCAFISLFIWIFISWSIFRFI